MIEKIYYGLRMKDYVLRLSKYVILKFFVGVNVFLFKFIMYICVFVIFYRDNLIDRIFIVYI